LVDNAVPNRRAARKDAQRAAEPADIVAGRKRLTSSAGEAVIIQTQDVAFVAGRLRRMSARQDALDARFRSLPLLLLPVDFGG